MKTLRWLVPLLVIASLPVAAQAPEPTPGISVIEFVGPAYPFIARAARIEGDVRVLVAIAPDGSAQEVTTLSGHPMLVDAATAAVKQWKFGCQRCRPPLRHIVTIMFRLLPPCQLPGGRVKPELPLRLTVEASPPCGDQCAGDGTIHDPSPQRPVEFLLPLADTGHGRPAASRR
jgi:TonB family protein